MTEQYDFVFKILLIGDGRVGKSAILKRFVDNVYTGNTTTTIGVDYKIKSVEVDRKTIKLHIWDTAGEERFQAITSCYYRGCDGFLVVYDITNKESFKNLKHWLREISRNTTKKYSKVLLIGNKCDLTDARVIEFTEAKEFADKLGLELIETSAMNSLNVETAFVKMAQEICDEVTKHQVVQDPERVNLQAPPPIATGYCCSWF